MWPKIQMPTIDAASSLKSVQMGGSQAKSSPVYAKYLLSEVYVGIEVSKCRKFTKTRFIAPILHDLVQTWLLEIDFYELVLGSALPKSYSLKWAIFQTVPNLQFQRSILSFRND